MNIHSEVTMGLGYGCLGLSKLQWEFNLMMPYLILDMMNEFGIGEDEIKVI